MRNCRTIDIEAALVDALDDYTVSAPPIPIKMQPPCVCVWRTGGYRRSYVQDVHQVSIDCYGITPARAQELADELTEVIGDLEGSTLGGVPCYSVDITTLPYNNPDPDRANIARITFAAQIVTRVEHPTS